MRRLRPTKPPARPDARPALLAIISVMLLLLPFLLLSTTPEKLASIPLQISALGTLPALPPQGPIERLDVQVDPNGNIVLRADVQLTDVRARPGEVERREQAWNAVDGAPDLKRLQTALQDLHRIDPRRTRIRLQVDDAVPTGEVTALIDAVRQTDGDPLFPDVVLEGTER